MNFNHPPRHETEEERALAYKELRKKANRKLYEYGHNNPVMGGSPTPMHSVSTHLRDPEDDSIFNISKITTNGEPRIDITLCEAQGDDIKEVIYMSTGTGTAPFLRQDSVIPNPAILSQAEVSARPVPNMASLVEAIEAGINNQPITAEEAVSMTEKIERSLPV